MKKSILMLTVTLSAVSGLNAYSLDICNGNLNACNKVYAEVSAERNAKADALETCEFHRDALQTKYNALVRSCNKN